MSQKGELFSLMSRMMISFFKWAKKVKYSLQWAKKLDDFLRWVKKVSGSYCSAKIIILLRAKKGEWLSPMIKKGEWLSLVSQNDDWIRLWAKKGEWLSPMSQNGEWLSLVSQNDKWILLWAKKCEWLSPMSQKGEWLSLVSQNDKWILLWAKKRWMTFSNEPTEKVSPYCENAWNVLMIRKNTSTLSVLSFYDNCMKERVF
jgi:hypothetical protein